MNTEPSRDWTTGPAKWAAVVVLGGASMAGMAWSVFWRVPAPPSQRAPQGAPPAPVPAEAEPAPAVGPKASVPRLARVNINTASVAELELLPGVGPSIAARIVEHRTKNGPFKSVTGLDDVKGIGPKTVESLRPLVTVE